MFTYNVDDKHKVLTIYTGTTKVLDIKGNDFDKLCNTLSEIDLNCSDTGNKVLYRKGRTFNLDKKDSDFIQRWTILIDYLVKGIGEKDIYSVEEVDRYTYSLILRSKVDKKYIYKMHKKKPNKDINYTKISDYNIFLVRVEASGI